MFVAVARLAAAAGIVIGAVVYSPATIGEAGPSPRDAAREDLTRIDYPSQRNIPWQPRFVRPSDTVEALFGDRWEEVARFNRIDRRHIYPGMTLKVPVDLEGAKKYTPMPAFYEPAKRHEKYIVVSLTEQWLGAYEYGRLKFSMPAATGATGHLTPTGIFHVDARHRTHTSSLYKTEDQEEQYPMDYAFRFNIGPDNVSYWIHSRDLPGKPASHGCIGVYNEVMQNRMYDFPQKPALLDAQKLYAWAVGEDDYEEDTGELEELEDGPVVEVVGVNPVYSPEPLTVASARQ
jgi:hypothetical protein